MSEDTNLKLGKALDLFTGKRDTGADWKPQDKADRESFPREFANLKLSVIRPVFEAIGRMLTERGHEFHVAEEPGGKISIHVVPAGVNKSIHPYDWFPTLSFFGAPYTRTIGLHGRNMRPNSEVSSGSRGEFKPGQISREVVEKELMKFIGEISNW